MLKPPFDLESARQKVQLAQELWNTRHPERVTAAYTTASEWRKRGGVLVGREEITAFLHRKWQRELN